MIYLIGGPARTGKSILANIELKTNHIPYCGTDTLVHMLKKANPESGVTDKVEYFEKAKRLLPYLDNFLKIAAYDKNNYLVEGDAISPESVIFLIKKHKLKSVFLINTNPKLKEIVDNVGDNDWLTGHDDDYQAAVIKSIKENSELIKKQCEELKLRFFDTGKSFEVAIMGAKKYIFET